MAIKVDDSVTCIRVSVVQKLVLFSAVFKGLIDDCAGHAMAVGSFYLLDHMIRCVREKDPSKPAVRVLIAFVHNNEVSSALIAQDKHFTQNGSHI
jgi:hypothetical protein